MLPAKKRLIMQGTIPTRVSEKNAPATLDNSSANAVLDPSKRPGRYLWLWLAIPLAFMIVGGFLFKN
jgi:hypothetical protein